MKDNGIMIRRKGRVLRNSPTDAYSKATISSVSHKELAAIVGHLASITMANGLVDSNMAQACGEAHQVILIRENGKTVSLMVMVYIFGSTETNTKDNSRNVLNMEKV